MTTKEKKEAQFLKLSKKYNLNLHRQIVEDEEVISFLDHISMQTVGRVPEYRDPYGSDDDDDEDANFVSESVPPEQFFNAVREFIENCQNQGRITKVEIEGNTETAFGDGEHPAFQILLTRNTPRYETDSEVLTRLRKLDLKKTPKVAKKKKVR